MAVIRWVGAALQILGVSLLATRLGPPGVAFAVMLGGSLSWVVMAFAQGDLALFALNLTFTVTNIVGMIRWAA